MSLIGKIVRLNLLNKLVSFYPVRVFTKFLFELLIRAYAPLSIFPPLTFILLGASLYYFVTDDRIIPIFFPIYFLVSIVISWDKEFRCRHCANLVKSLFGFKSKDIMYFIILIFSLIIVIMGVII
jgi:hypothetical protein